MGSNVSRPTSWTGLDTILCSFDERFLAPSVYYTDNPNLSPDHPKSYLFIWLFTSRYRGDSRFHVVLTRGTSLQVELKHLMRSGLDHRTEESTKGYEVFSFGSSVTFSENRVPGENTEGNLPFNKTHFSSFSIYIFYLFC